MTSIQILLLNLLYDILCIVLPWDNVDEEETCLREIGRAKLGTVYDVIRADQLSV